MLELEIVYIAIMIAMIAGFAISMRKDGKSQRKS